MPTTLSPVLLQSPFVEPRTGVLTRMGAAWLQQSYLRQGGQEAATNTELAGGVQDNSDHIGQVEDGLGQTNDTIAEVDAALQALATRVTTLEGTVTALQATVTAQGTRVAALEAWKTAMIAALPALVSVDPLPTLLAAPATATLLRENLTTAWEPPLEANDTALQAALNAVRNALAA